MKVIRFEDLEVWKKGRELTRKVYSLTKMKKFAKDFSLCDQIRKAVISITSNIAEGVDAGSNSEFISIPTVFPTFSFRGQESALCCA